MCSEVFQPGGYWSSSGSGSVTMESQSSLKKFIEEGGLCVGPVEHLLVGDMFRP